MNITSMVFGSMASLLCCIIAEEWVRVSVGITKNILG